jgi:hypothetical protein
MKRIFISFAIIAFLVSCGPSEQDQKIDALYGELIEGHDVVMPLSMKLPKLKNEVLASVDSLQESDSLKIKAIEISKNLISANEEMYTWMDAFAVAMNDVEDKEEKLKLYEKLKLEIEKLDLTTHERIDNAKKILESNE